MRHRTLSSTLIPLSLSLLLVGCASSPASPHNTPAPDAGSSESSSGTEVTVDNCGTPVTFDSAPERVVTIKSTSLEMMLALGLRDKIVASAFLDGPVREQWADSADDIPLLSDSVPSEEAVLQHRPDFVYAGWESNFSADGAGERSNLHSLGVNTYVSPAACKEESYQPSELTFDEIFSEIREFADIFRVDPTDLIDQQKATLAEITPTEEDLSALWYSSGSDIPFVGAGIGAPQLMMETLGLENIAGDIDDTWSSMSWEAVVAADPDVIILVDSAWGSTDKKISVLEGNPVTRQLSAVKDHRYLVIPFPASEAGVRSVPATADLSRQLAELRGED